MSEDFRYSKIINAARGIIGTISIQLGLYDKALSYLLETLDVYQEIGDMSNTANILNNLETVSKNLGSFNLALIVEICSS